jgi:hypothetical protein
VTNNEADVDTDISVNANTGGNKIGESNEEKHGEENQSVTTGDATISTGNATAEATVTNAINNTTVTVEQEKENEQNEEEEENEGGQGGGPVVTPTTAAVAEGGLGSGAEVAAVTTSEGGLGAGETTGGLGAGPLAEAGFEGLLPPIILSSIVTFFMALKRKKYTI